ncbi:PREDICTED: ALK tyrosine kinase receptor-like isoform X3 [Acropora digitifera]|uniref:ALK tyrosine kinase receptor-like isoform X3 n=2 Tax=Acropora digitifera TaxID=70779 RepID=UPI00077AF2C9|nr:PREDICTED: ALK tyrosine kinase receptor-like isoform X3 [Acropora digitifera]
MKILLSSSILFLAITTVRLQLQRTETSRSSTVSITENHVLIGCGIHKQRSYDFLSCVHLCLARSYCASVNYENVKNGMCELNRLCSSTTELQKNIFIAQWGYVFGQLILSGRKYIFTTLGARGPNGPIGTAGYQGTSLEEQVILNKGIQIWTVPVTGSYVIEASGASGANGTEVNSVSPFPWKRGGLGAKITGTFRVNQGTHLKILVGQEGGRKTDYPSRPGGGGGGSFVTLQDDTPLIIAGGGGGGGASDNFTDGDPGQATGNGTRCGGTKGDGGKVCNANTGKVDPKLVAGGGAGIRGDGYTSVAITEAALSFINGGTGGKGPFSNGGFGGGSFALGSGGGGGGYSGGGVVSTKKKGTAGGGGSYNVGENQQNVAGANQGDGKVVITFLNP